MMDVKTIVDATIVGAAATGVFFAGRQLCRRAVIAIKDSRVPSRPSNSPFDTPEFRAEDAANEAVFKRVRAAIDVAP